MHCSSRACPRNNRTGRPQSSVARWVFSFFSSAAAGLIACSCAWVHSAPHKTGAQRSVNEANVNSTNSHGYALLYVLVKDEKDISKLRLIKRERPELKALLQDIARTNHQAASALEAVAKTNAAIDLKHQGLPAAEVQARAAISKFKENAILHSKDKELEIQLLLSQNEALTYGCHLALVLAASEVDSQRKQFLQQLATSLSALQRKVVALIVKNYSWEGASVGRQSN